MSDKPTISPSQRGAAGLPHVVHLETGRFVYGGGRQVLYLTEHLPALGMRSTLVCAKGGEMAARARAAGTEVIELATIGALRRCCGGCSLIWCTSTADAAPMCGARWAPGWRGCRR